MRQSKSTGSTNLQREWHKSSHGFRIGCITVTAPPKWRSLENQYVWVTTARRQGESKTLRHAEEAYLLDTQRTSSTDDVDGWILSKADEFHELT